MTILDVFVQVLGLVIEVMKKNFQRHISSILPVTKRILHSAIDAFTNTQMDLPDEATIPFWKESYYSLIMLEKMLHHFRDISFERELEVWPGCFLLLGKNVFEIRLPFSPFLSYLCSL